MHTFGSEKLRFVGTYLSVLYLLSYIRTTWVEVGIFYLIFVRNIIFLSRPYVHYVITTKINNNQKIGQKFPKKYHVEASLHHNFFGTK